MFIMKRNTWTLRFLIGTISFLLVFFVVKVGLTLLNGQKPDGLLTSYEFDEVKQHLDRDDLSEKEEYFNSNHAKLLLQKRIVQLFGEQGPTVISKAENIKIYKIGMYDNHSDNSSNHIDGYPIKEQSIAGMREREKLKEFFLSAENLFGRSDCDSEFDYAITIEYNKYDYAFFYSSFCGFFEITSKQSGQVNRHKSGFVYNKKNFNTIIKSFF